MSMVRFYKRQLIVYLIALLRNPSRAIQELLTSASMPRHQVTAPVTTAFRVATPDILRQILLHATASTLAACARVSQNFYHVAGPILYQDVEVIDNSAHFLVGLQVRPKEASTRSSPEIANLKAPLLRYIKTVTVTLPEPQSHRKTTDASPPSPRLALLAIPRYDTVRIQFQPGPFGHACYGYFCTYEQGPTNLILIRTSFKKVVLAPPTRMWYYLLAWQLAVAGTEALTMVVSPPDLDFIRQTEITWVIERMCMIELRIIFCAWPDHEDLRRHAQTARDNGNYWPKYSESMLMQMVYDLSRVKDLRIQVYLVNPQCVQYMYCMPPHPEPLLTKARATELFGAFEVESNARLDPEERVWAKVVFKDRKDYLMEAVTDEIDSALLASWKRAQAWDDQASYYDQYHSAILCQRREEYDHHANHPETIQEAQLIEEYQTNPDILLEDWKDRCARAEELAEWIVETQDWEDQANFYGQYRSVIIYKQGSELEYRTEHPDTIPEAQLIEEYQSYPDIPLRHWEQRCVPAEELAEWIVETQDWEDQADFYNQDRAVTIYQQGVEHDVRIDHPDIIPDAQLSKAYQSYLDILLQDWEQHGAQAEELAEWIDEAQIWEDQVDFYDQYHPLVFSPPREQVDYYTNHPDTIPVAQLIDEYQIEADILFLAEEQRHVAAAELAEWIDEGVTMTLVQELIYRHHFDNLFHPFRKARESSAIITNDRNMLPSSEPTADERSMDPCSTGRSDCR